MQNLSSERAAAAIQTAVRGDQSPQFKLARVSG
jgi:hypothetical protein